MGMYDEINKSLTDRIITHCPYCNDFILNDEIDWRSYWQTKDFDCLLKTLDLKDIESNRFEMHVCCSKCGRYLSADVNLDTGVIMFKGKENDVGRWADIEDKSLIDEFIRLDRKRHEIDNNSKEWLKLRSIGYNEIEKYIYLENRREAAKELLKDFYIIPKSYLEDFT